jgi:short-subunit dehydrogenase
VLRLSDTSRRADGEQVVNLLSRRNASPLSGWPAAALIAGGVAGVLANRAIRARARNLAGQTAWVNGASRGLGLLIARELARQGCAIAITARDARELEAARQDLERITPRVAVEACDVSSRAQVEKTAASLQERLGDIDILVNCASIIQVGPLKSMTAEDFERAMAINFFGYLYPALALLPRMRERRAGTIVNIGSIGGVIAVPHLLPYTCAKFAVSGLTEGLRAELSNNGISVIEIVPGLMRTGSPVKAEFKGAAESEWSWFSLSDSLPLLSLDAERAARRIVTAIETGESRVTLGMPAKIAETARQLSPALVRQMLKLANRMLPKAASDSTQTFSGIELANRAPRSWIRKLLYIPAQKYNQPA